MNVKPKHQTTQHTNVSNNKASRQRVQRTDDSNHSHHIGGSDMATDKSKSNQPKTTRPETLREFCALYLRLNRENQEAMAAVINGMWLAGHPDRMAEVEKWMHQEREQAMQTEKGQRDAAQISKMIDQELIQLHLEKYGGRRFRPAR